MAAHFLLLTMLIVGAVHGDAIAGTNATIFPPENADECSNGSLLSWPGGASSVRCVQSPVIPECASGEVLTGRGGRLVCRKDGLDTSLLYVRLSGRRGALSAGGYEVASCDSGDVMLGPIYVTCTSDFGGAGGQAWVEAFGAHDVQSRFPEWPNRTDNDTTTTIPGSASAACDMNNDGVYDGGGIAILCLKQAP